MVNCWKRLEMLENVLTNGQYCYHSECYKATTNKTEINRSRSRYEKSLLNTASTDKTMESTPEASTEVKSNASSAQKITLRSSASLFSKEACIICQKRGGKLYKVAFTKTGQRMLEVAKKLEDQSFFLRLNTIPNASDAIANDVQYHLTCWVLAQRRTTSSFTDIQDIDTLDRVLADIEIVNMVQNILTESPDAMLDMKSLSQTYNNMIDQSPPENHKRYIKQLLQENVPEVVFVRPPARNQAERVYSSQSQSSAIEKAFKNSWDSYTNIFEAARIVRKDVLQAEKWQFTGTFDGFVILQSLKSLLHWIITGPRHDVDTCEQKKKELDKSVNMISEIIMGIVKTDRQVKYKSDKGDNAHFLNNNETPFTVGLGLDIHKATRSKKNN